jgi:hypothetical protein
MLLLNRFALGLLILAAGSLPGGRASAAEPLADAERLLGQAAFALAADAYEAHVTSDGARAPEAFRQATALRYLLEDEPALIQLEQQQWQRAARLVATRAERQAANLAVLGTRYLARLQRSTGRLQQARDLLALRMRLTDRYAGYAERAAAHSLLADCAFALGGSATSSVEYTKVLALGQVAERHSSQWSADAQDALGRAQGFFADQQFTAAMAIRLPAHTGGSQPCTTARAHIFAVVVPWLERKRRAVERANAAYMRMLGITPPPPVFVPGGGDPTAPFQANWEIDATELAPEAPLNLSVAWAVYAAERMGTLASAFHLERRESPIPHARCTPNALSPKDAYINQLDSDAGSISQEAEGWFRLCVNLWGRHRVGPGDACARWLDQSRHLAQERAQSQATLLTLPPTYAADAPVVELSLPVAR